MLIPVAFRSAARLAAGALLSFALLSPAAQAQPAAGGNTPGGFFGMAGLPLLRNSETRSISAENPTGERAGGAKATPRAGDPSSRLGPGWKVRPAIDLAPGATTTLADVAGPGVIQHIWITATEKAYRDCILRF
ncbi:MAG TPA: hypothetical protein VHA11_01770, partial [Bryobacteraceae bacterium]|nr:hypothetical protein [Bryobacteraceae bacterium]